MREQPVEKHLADVVKARGGRCIKLNPQGLVGIPDRLCIMPGGRSVFVEVKRPKGGVTSPMQHRWHTWLAGHGHEVVSLKNKGEIDEYFA
tara:strand:+ start:713 stop:982 length:270 start_codon:yes stop_codon:yes gene_type:complete